MGNRIPMAGAGLLILALYYLYGHVLANVLYILAMPLISQ